MRLNGTVVAFFLFACSIEPGVVSCRGLVMAFDETEAAQLPTPKTKTQVLRALEIAKLAATNGMQDLSLRAVREAFAGGYPVPGRITITPFATSRPGFVAPSRTYNYNLAFDPGSAVRLTPSKVKAETFHTAMRELDELWHQQEFNSEAVFKTLLDVVIPPGQQNELCLYERTFSSAANAGQWTTGFSAAQLLIEWAVQADSVERLDGILSQLKQHRKSQLKATLLQCQLSIRTKDIDSVRSQLGQLRMYVKQNSTGAEAQMAAQLVFPLLGDREVATEAALVAELVLDQILAGSSKSVKNHVEPATSILKTIAETYRVAGNTDKVRETVARLLNTNSTYNLRYSSQQNSYVQRLRQAQVATAATMFIEAGMFEDAAPLVAEYYSLKAKTGRTYGHEYGARMFGLLAAMPLEKRYRVLRLLCLNEPGEVRIQSLLAARVLPPQEFAAALATQNGRFQQPAFGPFHDVLTTAQLLVDSAKQLGKLEALQQEMQPTEAFTGESLQNAEMVLFFALLESEQRDFAVLNTAIEQRTTELNSLLLSTRDLETKLNSMNDYAIAAQAMTVPELRDAALRLLTIIEAGARRVHSVSLQSHASRLMAYSRAVDADVSPDLILTSGLKHWHAIDCDTDQSSASGNLVSGWVAQDGYVKNLFSAATGLLFFRYPLEGRFSVSASITDGDSVDGGFVYDGILSQSLGKNKSALTEPVARAGRRTPRVALTPDKFYSNSCELQIEDGQSRFRINRHVALTGKLSGSSPFLALHSRAGSTPGFHSIRITGNPRIPREVKLLSDHRLRGWSAFYSTDALPAPFSSADKREYSWKVVNGELVARRGTNSTSAESLLSYHRPLLDGEKVAWQFRYSTGRQNVHPTVGRIAFLMRPEGVQLHWITDGPLECSGLSVDNAITDEASLRTRKLPFNENDWNLAELSLTGNVIQIHLNGELILERQHNAKAGSQFGFFRNASREDAVVRNVTLSGDWPATFEEAVQGGLLALENPSAVTGERTFVSDLITTDKFNRMGYQMARQAESLPVEERYSQLADWVLPGELCRDFRVAGGFATGAFERLSSVSATDQSASRRPGELVSPALDLVKAASAAGTLDELQQIVRQLPVDTNNPINHPSKIAILSVIATAQQDFTAANRLLLKLTNSVSQKDADTEGRLDSEGWPAAIAAWNALQFAETVDASVSVLDAVHQENDSDPFTVGPCTEALKRLKGMAHYRSDLQNGFCKPLPQSFAWKPVASFDASSLPLGNQTPNWALTPDGRVTHYGGTREDFLYYHSPIVGDFAVEFQVKAGDTHPPQILYGGYWVGLNKDRTALDRGRTGFALRPIGFTEKGAKAEGDCRFRMVVRNGVATFWVNETKILEETLSAHPDPWLALRCSADADDTVIQDLKISGPMTVPAEIQVSSQTNLRGWTTRHFKQSMRYAGADWLKSEKTIVGANRRVQLVSRRESLIQYHRPMLEDGEVQFAFQYSGRQGVHPAIGRTAFILGSNGVQEHVITNGVQGHDGPGPENSQAVHANQLKSKLNLLIGENWCTLTLEGDVVVLSLNGEDIYRKTLTHSENRQFGFFHYPGESEAMISNVVYRGDWDGVTGESSP